MSIKSGLASQIGFATETTYGTFVAPSRFLPFVSESLTKDVKPLESAGIISGARVRRSQQWAPGDVDGSGSVGLEVYDRSIGLPLRYMFGAVSTGAPSGGLYPHTYTPGDLADDSFVTQVGLPDVGGTVRAASFLGCMVKSWEVAVKAGEIATLGMDLVFRDLDMGQSLGTNSLASGIKPMTYIGGSVTIAGSAVKVRSISLKGDNGLAVDDRRFLGSALIDQPVEADLRQYTGEFECDFADLTQYNHFVAGDEMALVFTLAAGAQTLVFTCNVRYDGDTPKVEGKGVLKQTIPFVCVGPSSDAGAITAVFTTTESTP